MPYVSCSDFGSVKGPSISKAGIPLLQVDFAPYISLITRETKDSSLVGWFWFCRFGCCCCCWGFFVLGVVVFFFGWFPPMCRRDFHSRVFMFRTRSLQHLSPPLEILFRGGLQSQAGHCLLTLSWSISLQNCKKCFFRNKREARVLVQADASKGENCRLQLCYLMDYGISAFMKCGFSTESAPQCRIYCNIHLK